MKKKRKPLCGVDMKFYQDMGGHITKWLISSKHKDSCGKWSNAEFDSKGACLESMPANSTVFFRTFVYSPCQAKYLLDYRIDYDIDPVIFVNEEKIYSLKYKIHLSSPDFSAWLKLKKGWNELIFKVKSNETEMPKINFMARIITSYGVILTHEYFSREPDSARVFPEPAIIERKYRWDKHIVKHCLAQNLITAQKILNKEDLKAYTPGIGAGTKSAGRFGFNKGDGMLDCSMPVLGMFAKPYLFGHPEYKKSILWHFSVMPPGISDEDRFLGNTVYSKYVTGKNESLEVNWISVNWKKQLETYEDFYHRAKGDKVNFSCTYSVASPGIIIESDDAALSLNGLEAAGNYNYVLLPLSSGRTVRRCTDGSVYDRRKDGDFTDNWILVWGNDSFPDVPVMITLQKNPKKIVCKRREYDNRLSQIDIVSEDTFGWGVLQFPFGFQVFKPEETESEQWLRKAVEKCLFQSKAALAYPIDCEEFYKVDKEKNNVDIIQKFSYRFLEDSWQSKAVMTAPLPPPLSFIENLDTVKLDPAGEDFDFPTKYGFLKGVIGRDYSSYTIPLPPVRRKFCLKPSGDESTAKMISSDFKEYLAYHQASAELSNPGAYQFILQYAIPLLLFNFINKDEREILEKIVVEGIKNGTSPETEYSFTGGKKCLTWYKRTEPFTGLSYMMTYLHVGGIKHLPSCDLHTIENHNITFNEIDWGNALAIYSIYLGALLTGCWQPVRENWRTLKCAFDYFRVLQDWACMATAYREEGTIWNDGTNYGAYLGFVRIAEFLEDEDAYNEGMYAFAKLAALRLGIFRSSQNYFHKYFGVAPYWVAKCFNEETDASKAFINVPETHDGYRPESIYNMTTEGHYPEAWEMYSSSLPDEVCELLQKVENAYGRNISKALEEGEFSGYATFASNVLSEQELFSSIMMALDTGFYSNAKLLEIVNEASKEHRLSEKFLGISASHRRIPAKWTYCFLKSQVEGDNFPLCLTGWHNLRIDSAEYDAAISKAIINISVADKNAWVEFEIKKTPENIYIESIELTGENIKNNGALLKICVNNPGVLEIQF